MKTPKQRRNGTNIEEKKHEEEKKHDERRKCPEM